MYDFDIIDNISAMQLLRSMANDNENSKGLAKLDETKSLQKSYKLLETNGLISGSRYEGYKITEEGMKALSEWMINEITYLI